jgi:hypothetical protein
MPIACKILSRKYKDCNIKSNDNQHKTKVNSGNSADYRNQLHNMITQELDFNISRMIEDLHSDINHIDDVFNNLLHKFAERCKKQRDLEYNSQKWFDTDCCTAKYKKIKLLTVFRKPGLTTTTKYI